MPTHPSGDGERLEEIEARLPIYKAAYHEGLSISSQLIGDLEYLSTRLSPENSSVRLPEKAVEMLALWHYNLTHEVGEKHGTPWAKASEAEKEESRRQARYRAEQIARSAAPEHSSEVEEEGGSSKHWPRASAKFRLPLESNGAFPLREGLAQRAGEQIGYHSGGCASWDGQEIELWFALDPAQLARIASTALTQPVSPQPDSTTRLSEGTGREEWPDQWMLRNALGEISHLQGGPVSELDLRYDQMRYVPFSRLSMEEGKERLILNDKGIAGLLDPESYDDEADRTVSMKRRMHDACEHFTGRAVELILRPTATQKPQDEEE